MLFVFKLPNSVRGYSSSCILISNHHFSKEIYEIKLYSYDDDIYAEIRAFCANYKNKEKWDKTANLYAFELKELAAHKHQGKLTDVDIATLGDALAQRQVFSITFPELS